MKLRLSSEHRNIQLFIFFFLHTWKTWAFNFFWIEPSEDIHSWVLLDMQMILSRYRKVTHSVECIPQRSYLQIFGFIDLYSEDMGRFLGEADQQQIEHKNTAFERSSEACSNISEVQYVIWTTIKPEWKLDRRLVHVVCAIFLAMEIVFFVLVVSHLVIII